MSKLFRAIVVMGAAITTPACDGGKKADRQTPAPAPRDAMAVPADASTDASVDAMIDAVVAADARPRPVGADAAIEVERVMIL